MILAGLMKWNIRHAYNTTKEIKTLTQVLKSRTLIEFFEESSQKPIYTILLLTPAFYCIVSEPHMP